MGFNRLDNLETAQKLVNTMLEKGVDSSLITENQKIICMISDRNRLKEVVANQKDLKKHL